MWHIDMKIVTPKYYDKFKCIADRCIHNCCTGWDIEIDSETAKAYARLDKKITEHIYTEDGCTYFKAKEDGRCPFFNRDGLCDIIIEHGEEMLCQICADHPRFKSFFKSFTEMGLGLCCEEAARLILGQKEKFCMPTPICEDLTENSFFKLRQTVFDILQDREFALDERLENVCDFYGIRIPKKSVFEWKDFFKGLEILDPLWTDRIDIMSDAEVDNKWDTVFEQLACYLVFRHLYGALDDGLYIERIGFCVIACKIVRMICAGYKVLDFETICDVCRAFSSEIEYSDQNPQTIFDIIE